MDVVALKRAVSTSDFDQKRVERRARGRLHDQTGNRRAEATDRIDDRGRLGDALPGLPRGPAERHTHPLVVVGVAVSRGAAGGKNVRVRAVGDRSVVGAETVLRVVEGADGDRRRVVEPAGVHRVVGSRIDVLQTGTSVELVQQRLRREVAVAHRARDLDDRAGDVRTALSCPRLRRDGIRAVDHRDDSEHAHEKNEDRDHHLDEREAALVARRRVSTHTGAIGRGRGRLEDQWSGWP